LGEQVELLEVKETAEVLRVEHTRQVAVAERLLLAVLELTPVLLVMAEQVFNGSTVMETRK